MEAGSSLVSDSDSTSDCNESSECDDTPTNPKESCENLPKREKIAFDLKKFILWIVKLFKIMPGIVLTTKLLLVIELLCVVLTLIHAVKNRGTSSPGLFTSKPFFPKYSLVTDFYLGDLTKLNTKVESSDLSFVFYYAPWDRQCQQLLPHFLEASKFYHEQITFMAVNCWLPNSECRSQYKVIKYPVLRLYIRDSQGLGHKVITYEGPLDKGHIIKFLSRSIKPLVHVTSTADITRLLDYNGINLIYINTSDANSDKNFDNYYFTSYKSLVYDHYLTLGWGVVTDHKVASALSLKESSIHLIMWNTTVVLKNISEMDSASINKWIFKKFQETTSWINVGKRKTTTFNNILTSGPALLLFTPNNPYISFNDPFTLLKSLALDYHNCDKLSRVKQLSSYLSSKSVEGRTILKKVEQQCRSYIHKTLQYTSTSSPYSIDKCCCNPSSFSNGGLIDIGISSSNIFKVFKMQDLGLFDLVKDWIGNDYGCDPLDSVCPNNMKICPCNDSVPIKTSTSQPAEKSEDFAIGGPMKDDLIAEMMDHMFEDECKRLVFGLEMNSPLFIKNTKTNIDLTGLGCKTNKTLNMIALDSAIHYDLAQRLGVNSIPSQPDTGVIIIDSQNEQYLTLKEPLSRLSLSTFIYNYTNGLLDRHHVSQKESLDCPSEDVCIQTVTLQEYLTMIEVPKKRVVALHYSSTCGGCTSASHVLLTVAKILENINNITFVRIDVSMNTMPWHLDFPQLPRIILHSYKKSETRIFDADVPLTAQNLIRFLIGSFTREEKITVALNSCDKNCLVNLKNDAESKILTLNASLNQLLPKKITKAQTPFETSIYHNKVHLLRKQIVHFGKLLNKIKDRAQIESQNAFNLKNLINTNEDLT